MTKEFSISAPHYLPSVLNMQFQVATQPGFTSNDIRYDEPDNKEDVFKLTVDIDLQDLHEKKDIWFTKFSKIDKDEGITLRFR